MSDAELVALIDYTLDGYGPLNRALRSGRAAALQRLGAQIGLVRDALSRLPAFRGRVNREARVDRQQLARYQVGAVVHEPTFLSTSPRPDVVFPGNVRFEVHTRTGRKVAFVSAYPDEAEVLLAPGACFEVVERRRVRDGEVILESAPRSRRRSRAARTTAP